MAPQWASLGLNGREMKKARTEAGRFLGHTPTKWDDQGSDRQKARSQEFLQHLRDTENSSIADKFMQGEETLLEFLRTRTKTIRNKKASQSTKNSDVSATQQCDATSLATDSAANNNNCD
ncbi:MAG: hypothetical protein ASARMPREDX12_004418 [Alectoria sarmentosa]|nr:MAG: hypothetical protein ASARMPREDX12_004418 [Alectoria sarmentosa]